ncbi:hypothetical protein EXW31_17105 [Bacillus mycoides]|uniref:polymorphic toxin type 8 domain-containing protein n=1 Tax=Bacillus TaxID=1386 RepID=UPI0002798F5F|nr:hypothetical protein IKO_02789 [Bacillus cereus VDM034]EJS14726.1 hypothetical protein IKS_02322 [Bacillus cereus VDM062]MBG9688984.1 hypothetical protein [Bacillus mycoides]PRD10580.1 hypothetical protein CQ058_08465 [Bacillus sp. MYb56]QWG34486.1 hypothetical protein EXW30_16825 [Bacillus mycoides]
MLTDPDGHIPLVPLVMIGARVAAPHIARAAAKKAAKSALKKAGRKGKNARLTELAGDPKVSKSLRGWIKQELNNKKRKKKKHLRNPPGYEMAHRRGKEARHGYGYEHSDLQHIKTHRTQHKHDGYGRKGNKKKNPPKKSTKNSTKRKK